jgi:stage V sporulation protein R
MASVETSNLPPELVAIQREMQGYARGYGLDFYPTIFEYIDADQLNAIAAKGGFPVRYPHWRFGMEYERLGKGYHHGLQKIYEMVINNDPCYAYLMRSNELVDQKLVMAHVYGHCDFFKNNFWFSRTSRKMMDEMANHGNRVRRYMDQIGVEEVEEFIDACLSIEDQIDIHSPFIRRREEKSRYEFGSSEKQNGDDEHGPSRFRSKAYMDSFINPPGKLAAEAKRLDDERKREKPFPERPERDLMLFLLEHAPLEAWQADVLSIIRDEAYYFAPQAQTKIMNEGWASYWHSTIMTRQGLAPGDVINYCDHHSGTLASSPTSLNPYKLGIELFRDIEDRWNRGAFGKEYDDCDDHRTRHEWNTDAGLGREKIFEVRRIHNDLTFIDEFLTLDFVREQKLFKFGYNQGTEYYEIESREFPKVKRQLLASLTNLGRPIIAVRDGNYKNRGELYLTHTYTGVELQLDYAKDTLTNMQRLWKRPVHLETVLEDTRTMMSYDGAEHQIEKGEPIELAEGAHI